jgi:hypothetical protein
METIRFLNQFGLDALGERFAVRARRHARHPNLLSLKYNQVFSPMHERVVQECRGLILDEADGWRVVCRSYDKFFNLGEPNAPQLDWPTARVFEKLDGSLMTLYRYGGEWHVASSGMPDAAGRVNDSGETFASLFRRTWDALGYRWPGDSSEADHLWLMFELMTPENRIICQSDRPRVVLHGVRDARTMRELDPEPLAAAFGWECVRSLPLMCAADCLEAAKALDVRTGEGFVVRDGAFTRVKIKSPRYVELTHLKTCMTGRRMLEIVRANESDEFLAYFPEFRAPYEAVKRAYDALCADIEANYARLRHLPDQRSFAAEATRCRFSSPLFAMRSGKAGSAREFLAGATLQSVERALNVDLNQLVTPADEE